MVKKITALATLTLITFLSIAKLTPTGVQAAKSATANAPTFQATYESSYTLVDPLEREKSIWIKVKNTGSSADIIKFYYLNPGAQASPAGHLYLKAGETGSHRVGSIAWGMGGKDNKVTHTIKIESTNNSSSTATATVNVHFVESKISQIDFAEITLTALDATTKKPLPEAMAYYHMSEDSRTDPADAGEDGKITIGVPTSDEVAAFAKENGITWDGYTLEVQAAGYQTYHETGLKPTKDAPVTKTISLTPLSQTASFESSWIEKLAYPGVWRVKATDDWSYIAVALGKHPDPWDKKPPVATHVYLYKADGELVWKKKVADTVWGMDITPDGSVIAAGTNNGVAYVWNKSGKLLWSKKLGGQIREARLSKTGKYFAVETNPITVFNAKTGKTVLTYDPKVDSFWRGITFSYDEKKVAFAGEGSLILMNIKTKKPLWRKYVAGVPYDVKMTKDVSRIVVADKGDTIWCYDGKGKLLWKKSDLTVLTDMDMTDDASKIVGLSHDGTIRAYDGDGKLLWRRGIGFGGHNGLDMTGDGKYIAIGGGLLGAGGGENFPYATYLLDGDGNLLWKHSESGPVPEPYHPYMMSAMSVAISEDATKIAAGYGTGNPAIQLFTGEVKEGQPATAAGEEAGASETKNRWILIALGGVAIVIVTALIVILTHKMQKLAGKP